MEITEPNEEQAKPAVASELRDRLDGPEEKMGKFVVWEEGSERSFGQLIEAYDEAEAVENWAEWDDAQSAEYLIVRGREARVFVALHEDNSKPMLFTVQGEPRPFYQAKPVSV